VASPEEIVTAAVEQKIPAVALTDTNGLYAAVQFYKLAQEAKVKPIVGVALDVEFHISKFEKRNAQFSECASNAAGRRHGRLQQLVPARHTAASRHNKIVTKHEPG
jgi:DNA polymerase III alpha subunit